MEEAIRFIDHQGKKILLVDFSNFPANEVEKIARAVPDYVTVNPRVVQSWCLQISLELRLIGMPFGR
jgi:hypothetical protein